MELISFSFAPAIPPVIMNVLEKRAFLKVQGQESGHRDGPLALCWNPAGEQHLPTSLTPNCPLQRYPYLNAPLQVGLVGLW